MTIKKMVKFADKETLLETIQNAPIVCKDEKLLEYCSAKQVLDVGCVGQDLNYNSDVWLHQKIRSISKRLIGVDIVDHEIETLREIGYQVINQSELKEIKDKFDVITISDVIEHVDSPVTFLRDYSLLLGHNGIMLVSTPNPFYFKQFLNILLHNRVSVNFEHTMWIDPITFSEISRRAGLKISAFYWCYEYYNLCALPFTTRTLFLISKLFYRIRKFYSPNMLFVLTK